MNRAVVHAAPEAVTPGAKCPQPPLTFTAPKSANIISEMVAEALVHASETTPIENGAATACFAQNRALSVAKPSSSASTAFDNSCRRPHGSGYS